MQILLGAWILTGLFNWCKYLWFTNGYQEHPVFDYVLGLPVFLIVGPITNFVRLFNGMGV